MQKIDFISKCKTLHKDIMYTFDPINIDKLNTITTTTTKNVITDNIPSVYDFKTNETYRMKRLSQRDVFNDEKINDYECFKYYKKWDPYTGETIDENDEFGPLCFNGFELSYFYYINRLNGLWNDSVDGFDGYYGDLLGTGKNINIISRGSHPEKYLLRLPIIDCYLFENSTHSHVTMGPVLLNSEIEFLDNILEYNYNTFDKYVSNRSNLIGTIKYHYDEALNPNPSPTDEIMLLLIDEFPFLNEDNIKEKYNRYHVDILKTL